MTAPTPRPRSCPNCHSIGAPRIVRGVPDMPCMDAWHDAPPAPTGPEPEGVKVLTCPIRDCGWTTGEPTEFDDEIGLRAQRGQHIVEHSSFEVLTTCDQLRAAVDRARPVLDALLPLIAASRNSTAPRTPQYQALIDAVDRYEENNHG